MDTIPPFYLYHTGTIFHMHRATLTRHLVAKLQKDRASSFRAMAGHGQTEPNLISPSGANLI